MKVDERRANRWQNSLSEIQSVNRKILNFWGSGATGWAPAEATKLLQGARLDRQLSLSYSLEHWKDAATRGLSDGDLILAWANLGSLIEGTMKLLLAVFVIDYSKDEGVLKECNAWDYKKDKAKRPEKLGLEVLIDYFGKANLLKADEVQLCLLVQSRRNAIHSFRHRCIGDASEFVSALEQYSQMLQSIEARLPYP